MPVSLMHTPLSLFLFRVLLFVPVSFSGRGSGQRSSTAVQQAGLPNRAPGGPVGPHPELHQPATGTVGIHTDAQHTDELDPGQWLSAVSVCHKADVHTQLCRFPNCMFTTS